jgi:peptide/nickel transport system permease protein
LDDVIQRLSDINIIIPILPIAIMVSMLYTKSIWAILGVVVALSIFGNNVKIFRAAFLQFRDANYIEAARVYGASHWRIIKSYLVPRIVPLLVPQLVIMVPTYVFYEATLAYLGVSDPYLPTWGKIIYDAITVSGFQGDYYWILQPLALLLSTSIAFAMLGFTLDRILNPRLKDQ